MVDGAVVVCPHALHGNCCSRCAGDSFADTAAALLAVGLDPGPPELFTVEVVDEKVCRRVEADQQVGHPRDDVDDRNFGDGAVVAETANLVANNQLVQVRNHLQRLAEDEQR